MESRDLDSYFAEGQRSSDWIAPTPIELLPALRLMYPSCITEAVLSVRLLNEHWPEHTSWIIEVQRLDGRAVFDALPLLQQDGDCYDYGDWSPQEYPHEPIQALLRPDRTPVWQELAGIFRPEALEMILRIQEHATRAAQQKAEFAAECAETGHRDRTTFLRDLALRFAGHLTESVDLKGPLKARLRAMPSSGVHGELCTSRWLELGAESQEPSLLNGMIVHELEREVWTAFQALPRTQQLALWFRERADADFPGKNDWDPWLAPTGSLDSIRLESMDDYCTDIARLLMRCAEDDYLDAVEAG